MDSWEVVEQAAERARSGERLALATVVWRQGPSSSQQGSRAIITADGQVRGWIGGACAEPSVIRAAQQVIESGTARLLLLGTAERFGDAVPDGIAVVPIACQSEGALEVYIEPVLPVPHLVVVGQSPMAVTLAGLARTLGWRVDLVAGEDFRAADAAGHSLVLVATQGHDDERLLELAAQGEPLYLGLVASRRRGRAVLGYLADRGVRQELLDRVRVPAGLDLGRTTHQEIAVAILAELVQLRASGALAGPAAGQRHGTPSEQSQDSKGQQGDAGGVDPVCGMTVAAGSAGLPLDHQGVTYYFCGAGCRQAFAADPAHYAERETRC